MAGKEIQVSEGRSKRPRAAVDYCSSDSSDSTSSSRISPTDRKQKRKMVCFSETPAPKFHNRKKDEFACSVDDIESNITKKEIINLFKTANISFNAYEFLVPLENQRADNPPKGYIAVYEEQIRAGLRFPLHSLMKALCDLLKISPCQLLPNTHRLIVGFILCAKFYGYPVDVESLFSLFSVRPSGVVKKMFKFVPMKKFLTYSSRNPFKWESKFFFLRHKDLLWNCITTWNKTFLKPLSNPVSCELAVVRGILKHRFEVSKLLRKELLVHGGIEPGISSAKVTFRYLMHKAALTKFNLLPGDKPLARASLAAHTNPSTSTAYAASPVQLRDKQPVNRRKLLSGLHRTGIPSATETPIRECFSASSEDSMENQNQEGESRESRLNTNFVVPVPDEAQHQSLQTDLQTLLQSIESKYVPKDHYQKLQKDAKELSSELAYTKSRILELEQELALSEAKRADSENKSFLVNKAMTKLEKRYRIRDSELARTKSRILELERELAVSEAKRVDSGKKSSLTNEYKKNLEKTIEDIKSDSDRFHDNMVKRAAEAVQVLEQRLEESEKNQDKIAKDAVEAFKSSPEFLKIVQEKLITDYSVSTDECGKSSEPVAKKCSSPRDKTIESTDVPRECCQKLEKNSYELTSKLTFTESRVRELEQEIELSKATKSRVEELEQELKQSKARVQKLEEKVAEAENVASWAVKSVENLKSALNKNCDKIIKDASEASPQVLSRMNP